MATQEMNGTNRLAERILSDAKNDAEKVLANAEETLNGLRAESEKQLAAERAAFEAKRDAAVKSVLDGWRTRAELDSRKSQLKKKRDMMEKAFGRAYERLLSLSVDEKSEICRAMLESEAEDGETVFAAKADYEAVRRALDGFTKAKVTLSDECRDFDGGFLIIGDGYEKDCSYRSLMEELRAKEETAVAAMLFSAEGGR